MTSEDNNDVDDQNYTLARVEGNESVPIESETTSNAFKLPKRSKPQRYSRKDSSGLYDLPDEYDEDPQPPRVSTTPKRNKNNESKDKAFVKKIDKVMLSIGGLLLIGIIGVGVYFGVTYAGQEQEKEKGIKIPTN